VGTSVIAGQGGGSLPQHAHSKKPIYLHCRQIGGLFWQYVATYARRKNPIRQNSMAHPGFGRLWQQEEMSDVQTVLLRTQDTAPVGDEQPEEHSSNHTVLHKFPGHSQILSICPYFLAQARIVSVCLC
jgi:hypothetical protein